MVANPPTDMPRITPHIFYDDVAAAMDWLVKAFGFEVRLRMTNKQGLVVHGELEVADSLVMLGLAGEKKGWTSPQTRNGDINGRLYIFVDDVDAHYKRAVSAGAKIVLELAEQFWGDRCYECIDLEGHRWKFAQHLWDVDNRNLKRPEDT
ncbi:MAG TPA: VOC family protein [Candidatus Angelobacter sp.]